MIEKIFIELFKKLPEWLEDFTKDIVNEKLKEKIEELVGKKKYDKIALYRATKYAQTHALSADYKVITADQIYRKFAEAHQFYHNSAEMPGKVVKAPMIDLNLPPKCHKYDFKRDKMHDDEYSISGENVSAVIKRWMQNDREQSRGGEICLLLGEPGHGKSCMCQYIVSSFLQGKESFRMVDDVMWFSLNPTKSNVLNKVEKVGRETIDLKEVLTFGSGEEPFPLKQLENCLIFLDGYDELCLFLTSTEYQDPERIFAEFRYWAQQYNIYFVITSRASAFTDQEMKTLINQMKIWELAGWNHHDQETWIEKYNSYINDHQREGGEQICSSDTLKKILENKTLKQLSQIPLLFQLIIKNGITGEVKNKTELYYKIYDLAVRKETQSDKLNAHIEYENIALQIWQQNDTYAVCENEMEISDLIVSYYMKPMNRLGSLYRFEFIHRSFYQYFLAYKIYRMMCEINDLKEYNREKVDEFFAILSFRRIEKDVLKFIEDLCNKNPDNLEEPIVITSDAVNMMILRLDETDGIVTLNEQATANSNAELNPLDRGKTVFANLISLNNLCIKARIEFRLGACKRIERLICSYGANNINLAGAHLEEAWLVGTDLIEANLTGAFLSQANLARANLAKAELTGANLTDVNLTEADLTGADLTEANLTGADLNGAYPAGADLTKADLTGAHLTGAYLAGAKLTGANLNRADLTGADLLNRANLTGTVLTDADLTDADLHGSDLSGADLTGAHLINTNLNGAILQHVKVYRSELIKAKYQEAILEGIIYIDEGDS